jgi:hypothetical protein
MIDHQSLFGAAGLETAKLGEIMDNAVSPQPLTLTPAKEAFSREMAAGRHPGGILAPSASPAPLDPVSKRALDAIRLAIQVDPRIVPSILSAARLYFDEQERLGPRPPGERWKEHIEFSPWRRLGVDRSTYKRLRILGALTPSAGERPRRNPKRGYPLGWRPTKAVGEVDRS